MLGRPAVRVTVLVSTISKRADLAPLVLNSHTSILRISYLQQHPRFAPEQPRPPLIR